VKKILLCVLVVLVLVSLPILPGCQKSTPTATKTLTIGGIAFLTGPAASGGIACKAGWELAADKYNDAGGLKVGNTYYHINMITEDDAMSADQAATMATKLTQQDGAKFILGPLVDAEKNVVYPIANQAGALMWVGDSCNASQSIKFDGNTDVKSGKALYCRAQWACDEVTPALLDYLKANYPNAKKVAVCGITEACVPPFFDWMQGELASKGLQRVGALEQIAPDATDYNPAVTRILSSNPDAIDVCVSTPVTWGFVVGAARSLGFKGPIFCSTHLDVGFTDTIAGGKNTDIFGAGINLTDMSSLSQDVRDAHAAYLSHGYAAKDEIADVYLVGYNGLWVLLQTIEKAKRIDPATVEKTYEGLTKKGDLQTLYGPAYVGGLKTYGVNKVLCEPFWIDSCMNGVSKNVQQFNIDIP